LAFLVGGSAEEVVDIASVLLPPAETASLERLRLLEDRVAVDAELNEDEPFKGISFIVPSSMVILNESRMGAPERDTARATEEDAIEGEFERVGALVTVEDELDLCTG
jgi:hypothetical protein